MRSDEDLALAVGYAQRADLAALPGGTLTKQQIAEFQQALAAWPHIAPQLQTVDDWLHVAPELLGLHGPTRLLVELIDQGETRATGGYIGDYGILTIENARIQPFSAQRRFTLDTPYLRKTGVSLHLLPTPGGRSVASGCAIRISRQISPPARN